MILYRHSNLEVVWSLIYFNFSGGCTYMNKKQRIRTHSAANGDFSLDLNFSHLFFRSGQPSPELRPLDPGPRPRADIQGPRCVLDHFFGSKGQHFCIKKLVPKAFDPWFPLE